MEICTLKFELATVQFNVKISTIWGRRLLQQSVKEKSQKWPQITKITQINPYTTNINFIILASSS
jgi:hypothetical protein